MDNINFTKIDLDIKSIFKNKKVGNIEAGTICSFIEVCKPITQYLSQRTLEQLNDYSIDLSDIYQDACIILINNVNKIFLTNRSNNLAIAVFTYLESGLSEVYPSQSDNIRDIVYLYDDYKDDVYEAYIANDSASIEDIMEMLNFQEDMEKILKLIGNLEQDIIKKRFGIGYGDEIRTLESIGKEYRLTPTRIRQIESKALRELRNPDRNKCIKLYL